jgi:hypothetical protein
MQWSFLRRVARRVDSVVAERHAEERDANHQRYLRQRRVMGRTSPSDRKHVAAAEYEVLVHGRQHPGQEARVFDLSGRRAHILQDYQRLRR